MLRLKGGKTMKCLLCGNEIPVMEDGFMMTFRAYIPVDGQEDKEIIVCGRCHLLSSINDNLKPNLNLESEILNAAGPPVGPVLN